MFEKIKANWKMIVFALMMLGSMTGYVEFRRDANAKNVVIILPDDLSEIQSNVSQGAAEREGILHKVFTQRARRMALEMYLKEKGDYSPKAVAEGVAKVRKVTDSDITLMAEQAKIPVAALGGGSLLKSIIEWLSDPANQEKLIQLAKLILALMTML